MRVIQVLLVAAFVIWAMFPVKTKVPYDQWTRLGILFGSVVNPVFAFLLLVSLSGCGALVGTAISTADHAYDVRESRRLDSISQESQRRYKAMADAGDPKGLYYMAFVHAANHMNEPPDGDVHNVKRLYEQAAAKGSNDAKVALGNMLICGSTGILWGACTSAYLPMTERDPQRGLALLKEAAEKSCSVTKPLIAIGTCRERERPIAGMIWLVYRYGKGGVPKDPVQEAYWGRRYDECVPVVDQINRSRGCLR